MKRFANHAAAACLLASTTAWADPLARGVSWSAAGDVGVSHSSFSTALALGETGELGGYVYSSDAHAIALEAVEQLQLVVDRTTPQYGFIGVALRHVARPESPLLGTPGTTATFQRIAVGPAYLFDGARFELGVGGALSVGYLLWGRSGVTLDLSAQVYRTSPLATNTLAMLSVGYVVSPLVDVPRRRPPSVWQPDRDALPEAGPCDVPAYQAQLREHRKAFVTVCPDQAEACAQERAAIETLDARLRACGGDHAP